MIIEYRLSIKEVEEAIKNWLGEHHRVSKEHIVSIVNKPMPDWDKQVFIATVDLNKRYLAGMD